MLQARGYGRICHIAQEHSFVGNMWQRLTKPDLLIYLEVSYENTKHRRRLDWSMGEYAEQLRRLSHARQHADLIVDTDGQTPEEVLTEIVHFLEMQPRSPQSSAPEAS